MMIFAYFYEFYESAWTFKSNLRETSDYFDEFIDQMDKLYEWCNNLILTVWSIQGVFEVTLGHFILYKPLFLLEHFNWIYSVNYTLEIGIHLWMVPKLIIKKHLQFISFLWLKV